MSGGKKDKNYGNNSDMILSLLIEARDGSEKAFEKLSVIYRPLLESAVASYSAKDGGRHRDELSQEALLACFRAVGTYDPLFREVGFGYYAKVCVENALRSELRRIARTDAGAPLPLSDTGEWQTCGFGADPAEEVIERENAEKLRALIRENLSDLENKVWWAYYSCMPARTIAEKLGKSQKSVENAVFRIRKKLRSILSERR